MLTTALRPYEGIADLYMIDPDGFIIRKWNSKAIAFLTYSLCILVSGLTRSVSSKINSNPNITITIDLPSPLQELNVGVLTEEFVLPLYPKVGFWTIRVVADGQASLQRNRI